MKKDVIIAIFIGFIFGAISAVAITKLPSYLASQKEKSTESKIASSSSPTPMDDSKPLQEGNNLLTIDKPVNEEIADKKNITVSGKASPGGIVVIDTDTDSFLAEVKTDSSFTREVSLNEGSNTVYVRSYNKDGQVTAKNITVYFTAESL